MAKRSTGAAGSETVRKAQQKNEDAGGGRFPTMTLTPAEMTLWQSLMDQDSGPNRGKAKRTLMLALAALEKRNDLTQDQVIDWIRRNAG